MIFNGIDILKSFKSLYFLKIAENFKNEILKILKF